MKGKPRREREDTRRDSHVRMRIHTTPPAGFKQGERATDAWPGLAELACLSRERTREDTQVSDKVRSGPCIGLYLCGFQTRCDAVRCGAKLKPKPPSSQASHRLSSVSRSRNATLDALCQAHPLPRVCNRKLNHVSVDSQAQQCLPSECDLSQDLSEGREPCFISQT